MKWSFQLGAAAVLLAAAAPCLCFSPTSSLPLPLSRSLPAFSSLRRAGCHSSTPLLTMQGKPGGGVKRIKSYYDVLGVQKKVGTDEIRRAYMGKAKTCHPDVSQSPDAAEQFILINQAYETLTDPETRARYDAQLFAAYARVADARLTEGFTPAQAAIVAVAGLASAAPVIIPLTLAKYCVEPFATTLHTVC